MHGYELYEVGRLPRRVERDARPLAAHEVRVRVAGCGVCHTDLGFLFDGVRTRQPLPLILGHEISGFVEEAGADHAHRVGQAVIVPAVIPCGACSDCLAGAPMICRRQVMPGNDVDGGFATHVVVPGHGLCVVPGVTDPDAPAGDVPGLTLRHLAVVADAVSTPYQALLRSGLQQGDLAVVIGLGGVGGYAMQIARARGAHVVGIDIDPVRLAFAEAHGALALEPGSGLRERIRAHAGEVGAPATRWKIFECSGTAPGQQTAWGLLVHGATLLVVGFTMDKVELRLSNLMAFDARALGNWGCEPVLYGDIVTLALGGAIDLVTHTEIRPLSAIGDAMEDVREHRATARIVLAPEAG